MNIKELKELLNGLTASGVSEYTPVTILTKPIEIQNDLLKYADKIKDKIDDSNVISNGIVELHSAGITKNWYFTRPNESSISFGVGTILVLNADGSINISEDEDI
ncbi:hypothetical protein [Morganella morganii]|uniref:hypothetical protein n=1 Tax=Morganella morganii TaxID=582 RepID=UPI0004681332|nr:hypothetical protein [Morganella morganii]